MNVNIDKEIDYDWFVLIFCINSIISVRADGEPRRLGLLFVLDMILRIHFNLKNGISMNR